MCTCVCVCACVCYECNSLQGTQPDCADVLTSFCAHSAGDFVQWVAGIRIVTVSDGIVSMVA